MRKSGARQPTWPVVLSIRHTSSAGSLVMFNCSQGGMTLATLGYGLLVGSELLE